MMETEYSGVRLSYARLVVCLIVLLLAGSPGQAQTASAQVTGSVTYRERIALPPDAIIGVQLADVSVADVAAQTVAESFINAEGRQVPVSFALTYDPAKILPAHHYSVRATIRAGNGLMMFSSAQAYPVLTHGAPSKVNLVLHMVGHGGKPRPSAKKQPESSPSEGATSAAETAPPQSGTPPAASEPSASAAATPPAGEPAPTSTAVPASQSAEQAPKQQPEQSAEQSAAPPPASAPEQSAEATTPTPAQSESAPAANEPAPTTAAPAESAPPAGAPPPTETASQPSAPPAPQDASSASTTTTPEQSPPAQATATPQQAPSPEPPPSASEPSAPGQPNQPETPSPTEAQSTTPESTLPESTAPASPSSAATPESAPPSQASTATPSSEAKAKATEPQQPLPEAPSATRAAELAAEAPESTEAAPPPESRLERSHPLAITGFTPLANTQWRLVQLEGKQVVITPPQRPVTLAFSPEGTRIAGSGGCNSYLGTFTDNHGRLELDPGGMTMMACPDPAGSREQKFVAMLRSADGYKIDGNFLLLTHDGKTVAKFVTNPPL
jgi:uncharacterized lipoprotein YbaY/heat shock protein HslJ